VGLETRPEPGVIIYKFNDIKSQTGLPQVKTASCLSACMGQKTKNTTKPGCWAIYKNYSESYSES